MCECSSGRFCVVVVFGFVFDVCYDFVCVFVVFVDLYVVVFSCVGIMNLCCVSDGKFFFIVFFCWCDEFG